MIRDTTNPWRALLESVGGLCEYFNDNQAWVPCILYAVDTGKEHASVIPDKTTSFGKAWHFAHHQQAMMPPPSIDVTDIMRIRLFISPSGG